MVGEQPSCSLQDDFHFPTRVSGKALRPEGHLTWTLTDGPDSRPLGSVLRAVIPPAGANAPHPSFSLTTPVAEKFWRLPVLNMIQINKTGSISEGVCGLGGKISPECVQIIHKICMNGIGTIRSRAKETTLFPFGGIKLCFVGMGRISTGRTRVESREGLQGEDSVCTKPWEWIFSWKKCPLVWPVSRTLGSRAMGNLLQLETFRKGE